VGKDVSIRFGRHRKGEPVMVPAGDYVYIGSAQGRRGSSTLSNRLLRHATRRGSNSPHRIRKLMVEQFQSGGMGGSVPQKKSLHWHVDYLLDLSEAEISHVIVLFGQTISERQLAKIIQGFPETAPVSQGLGAGDDTGSTHLLSFQGGEIWWSELVDVLQADRV
jgi:Uri superfamily endonuclease